MPFELQIFSKLFDYYWWRFTSEPYMTWSIKKGFTYTHAIVKLNTLHWFQNKINVILSFFI